MLLSVSFNEVSEKSIKLFPNPVKTTLNIELLSDNFEQAYIFNTSGVLIHTINTMQRRMNVDVTNFKTGTYYITFVSNGRAITKRFIKK